VGEQQDKVVAGFSWHAERNRAAWNRASDASQAKHGRFLVADNAIRWGSWQIPDDSIGALGSVRGLKVLEIGCGAGQLSIKLAKHGARVVALDISERQLAHARKAVSAAEVAVELVWASADRTPLASQSFDVVCSDHGALTYADPRDVIPEAARLLKPGGYLIFNTPTPWVTVCWQEETETVGHRLNSPYFGMVGFMGNGRLRSYEREDMLEFQLSYGDVVRALVRSGLVLEDLIELRPPASAETTYTKYVPTEWASTWPAEHIWKARKADA
jgi:2-polyprenyl-3-methyl-5-hydroxy-6-metoxy-1,4-benzoquinol methylase